MKAWGWSVVKPAHWQWHHWCVADDGVKSKRQAKQHKQQHNKRQRRQQPQQQQAEDMQISDEVMMAWWLWWWGLLSNYCDNIMVHVISIYFLVIVLQWSKLLPDRLRNDLYCRPVWARGRCRISPPRFLAECCKRQLNQVSLVLLYFRLSAFSDLYWVCLSVFSCTVLFVSISQVIGCEDRLRNDLYCVGWGVKLYSNSVRDNVPFWVH